MIEDGPLWTDRVITTTLLTLWQYPSQWSVVKCVVELTEAASAPASNSVPLKNALGFLKLVEDYGSDLENPGHPIRTEQDLPHLQPEGKRLLQHRQVQRHRPAECREKDCVLCSDKIHDRCVLVNMLPEGRSPGASCLCGGLDYDLGSNGYSPMKQSRSPCSNQVITFCTFVFGVFGALFSSCC